MSRSTCSGIYSILNRSVKCLIVSVYTQTAQVQLSALSLTSCVPQASLFASLCFTFFFCKMKIVIVPISQSSFVNWIRPLCTQFLTDKNGNNSYTHKLLYVSHSSKHLKDINPLNSHNIPMGQQYFIPILQIRRQRHRRLTCSA